MEYRMMEGQTDEVAIFVNECCADVQ